MSKPFFTVIMPLYNHSGYVAEAVKSVLNQTYSNFELIICNDGSTDTSLDIISEFRDDRLKIIDKPNGGTVTALNSCILESNGKYICWLSSDDVYAINKLEYHYNHHLLQSDSKLSVTKYGYIKDKKYIAPNVCEVNPDLRLLQFVFGNYINGLSVCVHRDIYLKIGLFNGKYKYAHDVDRWFLMLRHHVPAHLMGDVQNYTRIGSGNTNNADILGELDVIQILVNNLNKYGFACLMPKSNDLRSNAIEDLYLISVFLLNKNNLFFKYNMGVLLFNIFAKSLAMGGIVEMLPELIKLFKNDTEKIDLDFILFCLNEINYLVGKINDNPYMSFIESIVNLKNMEMSHIVKNIYQKYLDEGM